MADGEQRGEEESLEEQEISVFYMIPVGPDTRDVWQWEQSCSYSVSVQPSLLQGEKKEDETPS